MTSQVQISYDGCGKTSTCKRCKNQYRKAHYQANKDKTKKQVLEYRKNNPEWCREYAARWQHENKHIWAAAQSSRRARYKTSLSLEFKKEIEEIYKTCPSGFEVDHIVPLNGKNVSGLHVPWNLQHLPKDENRLKGATYDD